MRDHRSLVVRPFQAHDVVNDEVPPVGLRELEGLTGRELFLGLRLVAGPILALRPAGMGGSDEPERTRDLQERLQLLNRGILVFGHVQFLLWNASVLVMPPPRP